MITLWAHFLFLCIYILFWCCWGYIRERKRCVSIFRGTYPQIFYFLVYLLNARWRYLYIMNNEGTNITCKQLESSTILPSAFSADHHSSSINGIASAVADGACVPATLSPLPTETQTLAHENYTQCKLSKNVFTLITLINSFKMFGSVLDGPYIIRCIITRLGT